MEHVFIHCGTCDNLCFFLNIMTQISSHRGADPLVIGTAGSCVCCLMSNKKAKQMGGCSCPGSEVFFGARMFFFNIPLLLDKFEIMLNHGIVDELVVFSTYQRTAVKIHLQIYIFLLFTYIYTRIVSLLTMESCVLLQEVHQHLSSPIDSQEVQ